MVKNKYSSLFILAMLLFTMVFSITATPAYASSVPTDISGHWAQSQIEKAYAQGIVIGYPDGTFKPDQNVSRAEFVTMVNNAFGFKAETSTYFTDVKDTDWFAGQISRAKAAGYISGYEDGSFKPNNYISRQEVASIMSRIIKTSNPAGIDLLSRFIDADAISSWAQGAVASVIASGTMQGYPDQTFKPQNFITRAEAVVVLNQAIGIEPQPVTQSITSITVTGAGDATTVKNGSTLQMSAAVLPANATDKSVTWSLTNGTGTATIAEAGLLTGTGLGTVTVKATANDGSGVSGTEQITVTAATSSGGGGGGGGGGNGPVSVSEITYAAIAGVTAPVNGADPVAAITDTAQYTGTVAWLPIANPFGASQVYTATITLTPKTGYTLTGVDANFFTVAGATYTNPADSGVVTAVFPATAADAVIDIAAIAGVTAPVNGATPVTTATATTEYTAAVTWDPADATFGASTEYTATITLTPKTGYTLTGVAENFFTVAGATYTNPADSGVVTAVFPATAADAVIDIAAATRATPAIGDAGADATVASGADYTHTSTVWSGRAGATYIATEIPVAVITLAPKAGYTFAGLAAGSITVAGGTVTYETGQGVQGGGTSVVFTVTYPQL